MESVKAVLEHVALYVFLYVLRVEEKVSRLVFLSSLGFHVSL